MSLIIALLLCSDLSACIGLCRGSSLSLGDCLHRLKGQSPVNAVGDAHWFPITQITHEGHLFVVVEISRSERTGSNAFSATDTLLFVDAYHRHAAIEMDRTRGAHVDAGRASTVHAYNRNVQTLVHEAYHAYPCKMWCEHPLVSEGAN
jgi:hypothetical protein